MTSSSYASERPTDAAPAPPLTAWIGVVVFGGIMLLTLGAFQVVEGIVALYREQVFIVTADQLFELDHTVWGWTHLILGVLALAAGAGVLAGLLWARILGALIAALGAFVHLLFIPAVPIWGAILITMDILILYALCAHGGDVRRRHEQDVRSA
ncbi:hypothetical protein OWR29_02535 [Actinoplanes sp. Pm04-4]|uniref:DUF7144 domain-containing protein n=1 Tax=Paractinoplanes pyxinae TaxID=2997416 RepID=A0ABT4ARJ3_9ACTN|nr:hypothetical protein [Actinoplanes pyxinae]MCY1136859.1 hypothetical protein [Actinoplanes pyxinae]